MKKLSKNLVNFVLTSVLIFVFSSCKDELDQIDKEVENTVEEATILDGRLNFNSSESLKSRIEDLKSKSEEVLVDELEKLNNAGFRSLRPIVTESNLESVQQRYVTKTNGRTIDEAQEVTDYIGDDLFAAILNEEGLLQVGDSIYKYTAIGLFFVHESKLDHLNNFLEELLGSQNNARLLQPIDPCPILANYNIQGGQVTSLDSNINYYSAIDPCSGGGGGFPFPSPNPTPTPNPSDPIADFVNSLSPCNTFNGWANWLFGDSRICIDNFTDRSRVRTKFWNQDYLLWRSVGIKVKHQFRQFGIWYSSSIDEMQIGIRSAYHLYKMKEDEKWEKPVNTTKQVIYNNFLYNLTSFPQAGSPLASTASLPNGIDVNVIYDYPAGFGDSKTSEQYVNDIIYPEVLSRLDNFYLANNINASSIGAVLITVIGDTKVAYKRFNDYRRSSNVSNLEVILDNDQPNFQVGIKISGGSVKPDWKKFKLKAKNTFTDASIEGYGIGRRNTSVKGSLITAKGL